MSDKPVIVDHLFGDIDLPEKGFAWHKQRWTGVHHYGRKKPLKSQPGNAINLFVSTSSERSYDQVHVWYTMDEWVTRHKLELVRSELHWDMPRWGWLQDWVGELPSQAKGTMLRYKVAARVEGSDGWVYADNQADSFDTGTHYSIWYDTDQLPEWSRQARVYQVFIDRFNPGKDRTWTQTGDLMKPCGGTLKGVTEKLEHVQGLGFNTIWLTPIFASPTHHGYDISDYYQINPRLGTDQDFDDLVTQIHQRGMRLILDFVANHCSDQLPQFMDARSDPDSLYHDWFTWKHWPDKYQSFYDVKSMPELDLRYGKPARAYLLECAQHWLERGADGFRLDYAHGPAQDFWVDFRRACRQVRPDCWLFGEIIQPADATAGFAGGLDGSLDFHLCQALRLTFAQQAWPLSHLAGFLQAHGVYFEKNFSLPSFIDNHDMNRFLVPVYGDERLMKIALMLLYILPGPPIVYYGTEVGLSQNRSIHSGGGLGFDEARLPMDWQKASELGAFLKQLAVLRDAHPEIHKCRVETIQCDDEKQTLMLRIGNSGDILYLLINRSDTAQVMHIEEALQGKWIDGLSGKEFVWETRNAVVGVGPMQSKIVVKEILD